MHKTIIVSVVGLALLAAGCDFFKTPVSKVYQGVCISLEDNNRVLKLKNTEPTVNKIKGEQAVFDLTNAKVGLAPEPGDNLRVAYLEKDGVYVALKVMNVTKQNLHEK